MTASLRFDRFSFNFHGLRMHDHSFAIELIWQGCDASNLLDSSGTIISEKRSNPNRDSARGFEVVDEIKHAMEKECPATVSCADILALAARDSTVLVGGPSWVVPLGRRDSLGASIKGSNNNIPAPNNTLQTIITKFKLKGLDLVDLVALSGGHTIGDARCTSFRQRLYNQTVDGRPDSTLDPAFDNQYFKNLVASKGLLGSDEVLFTGAAATAQLVRKFARSNAAFFDQFAESMMRMGNIAPLTGGRGEIRKNCRRINK
ncbi:hypothetical protein ZIOFF_069193 [Zingiber officinale]|uniref:Plant heme peroxidase family profile domain-containing protein n=1 Tax=Zingiber officinale TaxID=94328 RepID=A0A8J5CBE4_ZINOF|nr:hypothetical protein ZIOFF_069193 [Zingiber officinale]